MRRILRRLQPAQLAARGVTLGTAMSLIMASNGVPTAATAAGAAISSPFKLIDNRVFVSARLDGQGPYSFLLDTGADGWTVSAKLAHRLALGQGRAEQIAGVGEAQETVHDLVLRGMNVAGLRFVDQPAVSEDFSSLNQVIGFQHFDGIAGKPVFDRYVVDLDFARSRVRFSRPREYPLRSDAMLIPFKFYEKVIPIVRGEIAGAKGLFVVDLGDRSSLTLFGPFWRAHHLQRLLGPGIIALTGYGVGGPVKGELVRVRDFLMAGIHVRGVIARLSLQKAGVFGTSAIAGSIGTGILKRFNVTFDYRGRRIAFYREPGRDVADAADRSGLWLGRRAKKFEVFDVVPKSPADLAGIKVGDIVTAVDGIRTERLNLFAVREELKSPAKKAISMTIEHDARSRIVPIALHDLIPND